MLLRAVNIDSHIPVIPRHRFQIINVNYWEIRCKKELNVMKQVILIYLIVKNEIIRPMGYLTQDLIWYQKYVGIARHWPSRALRAPPGGGDWRPCPQLFPKLPGTDFSHKAFLKTLMPLKVQLPLPPIGLELYQLGVHMRAKRNYYQQ